MFGIVDKNSHKAFAQFIQDKSHNSIIPLITRHCAPGCTINTDGAAVYKTLRFMNYTHNSVVHERYYVDPNTGIHSNWIENFWGNMKIKLKSVRGSQGDMLDGRIDEYLYRYNRKGEGPMFQLMIEDIANYYPI